jgi:acetyltransferase-like isoleucine patch superfamily enzyme
MNLIQILSSPFKIPILILGRIPYFSFLRHTRDYQCTITFSMWFKHKILNSGNNKHAYWPVHPTSKITNPQNIDAGIDTCPGYMGGCYIQGIGKIIIGDYTQIANNVSLISANHDLYDSRKHIIGKVEIGKYCWLGSGAKILPNVTLGDFTIVGAGAIVTKSFKDGYCVIGGNPAKVIKYLEKDKCIPFENRVKYYGYIKAEKFEKYRNKYLNN